MKKIVILYYATGEYIMNQYSLYLDESYTYEHNGKKPAFAIGGFIIKDSNIESINNAIDNLKKIIWSDLSNPTSIILHEMDLKDALNSRIPKRKHTKRS